ncbi:MAG: hypothetical protein V8Q88_00425 [Christensenellales bacterium]
MKETYQIPMAVKPEIDKVIAMIQKKRRYIENCSVLKKEMSISRNTVLRR